MDALKNINDDVLREELAKHDLELISHTDPDKHGTLQVEVKKLQQVAVKRQFLYVPVMATLSVVLGKNSIIKSIVEHSSNKDNILDAELFVKTLVSNKRIKGLAGSGKETTHEIEVNNKGQQVIKRTGFYSF